MVIQDSSELENIWEALLSRQPEQIQGAYKNLPAAEQSAVMAHLKRMACEPGWHAEQALSAQIALEALTPPPLSPSP